MKPITYFSDQAGDYVSGLSKCKTLDDLVAFVNEYRSIVSDAVEALPKDDKEFRAWRSGLAKERRGDFAGQKWAERYGPILLPALMLHVGMIANHFGVPWGCAFIRAKEMGSIITENGVSRWISLKED